MRVASDVGLPLHSPAAAVVFTTVLTMGPLSRVDVAERTGLSSAAVTKAVRPLLDGGYLEESPDQRVHVGRPASPLHVRSEAAFFVGVKVTADELIGVVTDLRARVRAVRHRALGDLGVAAVVDGIAAVVRDLMRADPAFRPAVRCLGVAVSGDVDRRTGRVHYSPFLGWRDVALVDLVRNATGLPTVLENDVRALTVAEQWFGAGVGVSSFALVTVGTGIGCGIVVHNAVIEGSRGVAGEIGHVLAEADGPWCHCGNRGCVESIAGAESLLAELRAIAGDPELSSADAMLLAHAGDRRLRAGYRRAGRAIGLALATVANLVGPERIVLSGEGLAAFELYCDEVRETFAARTFGGAVECELIVRPLPFEEWARGAAAVGIQTLITPGR
ncbi:MAG TPA: ROK family transcriptional regulator [Pseudonocardiaceae bacterium]|jgi:predicted NBD/HSP70 family sugar kinase|nr:ROK family transcriptional regulator [Pseudonocardiaceae bacterium]